MALVTERVISALDGLAWIDITFENTGQFLTDSFDVHNELPEPVRIRAVRNNVILYENWFGGGAEKNSRFPNVDTHLLVTDVTSQPLSWRRATKQTDWTIRMTYPSYPPP